MPDPTPQKSYRTFQRYSRSLDPIIGKPKHRLYTTTILSFLVISLFLWYAIRPTIRTILFLRREIADSTVVNRQMEEKIAALVEAQAVYQEYSEQIPFIHQALPSDPNVSNILGQISVLSDSTTASVSALQLTSTTSLTNQASQSATKNSNIGTGKIQSIPFSITVDGQYEDIQSLLEQLLALRRVVSIEDLRIDAVSSSKSETERENPLLKLTMKIQTYYHGEGGGGNK